MVPKGCLEPGKTPAQIALQEAWEEAGLTGVLAPDPVGSFRYTKLGNNFLVTVFLLHVNEAASEWPEADRRQRIWVPEAKAGLRVENPGLRRLLRQVALGAETASECQ